jgi:regulator of replication initiation timing
MAESSPNVLELMRLVGQLRVEVDKLKATVGRQDQRIDELVAENQQLRDQLEQAQRENARQAAPFRRREKLKKKDDEKKRPGRKGGHTGTCRKVPEQIDEEVEVPLDRCPRCGGDIQDVERIEQFIEEIPPVRPRVTRLVTYTACCRHCGDIRSCHPLQTSLAQGAAKVQLGPRALAIAASLNKHLGLTMRKTCRVLDDLFGLRLTAGGLSQALDRMADRLADAYDDLVGNIRGSPAVNADETSWWVGGPGSWLWAFSTPNETLYHVDSSRGSKVVRDILGDDYAGVLGSDCLASYNPIDCRKHKCIAHHLRAIGKARELPGQGDCAYLDEWTLLFKAVIVVHQLAVEEIISPKDLAAKHAGFEQWVDRLLRQPRTQSGDVKVQNRLKRQRPHLLTCLTDLAAEPTNNRAERALRPAVIARKLSCGNRTDRGRETWQILASLGQTCHQRGQDFLDFLARRVTLQDLPR